MTAIDPLDFRRVPILPFTVFVVWGVLLALYVPASPRMLCWAAITTCGVCILVFGLFRTRWPTILCLCMFFFSLSAYRGSSAISRETRQIIAEAARSDSAITITGRVQSVYNNVQSYAVFIRPVSVCAKTGIISSSECGIRVYTDSSIVARLRYGDAFTVRGRLTEAIHSASGSTGLLVAVLSRGEIATVVADSEEAIVTPRKGFILRRSIDRVREFIRNTFDQRLKPDAAALCRALVLGDRSSFSGVFQDRLRLTGLSHVFALSGVNVGVVITVFWIILCSLFIPRVWRLLILLVIALFYMELGREAPSLVRATLMAVFFIIGALIFRRGSVYNSVASAAFVELLWRPLDIIDAGFLLSYLAVLGILAGCQIIRPYFCKLIPTKRTSLRITDIAAATVSAQIMTLPLVAFIFHRIPLIGIAGNLIAVPLFAVMLIWSMLLLALEFMFPFLSIPVASSLNVIAFLAGATVNTISEIPFAAIALPSFSALILMVVYAGIIIAIFNYISGKKRRAWIVAAIVMNIIIWHAVLFPQSKTCKVTFLNVGEGDAALISTISGKHILVDAGPRYGSWSAADRILYALAEQHVTHLSALILTHADNDHIGGASEIIRRIPVDNVYANTTRNSQAFIELEAVLEAKKKIIKQLAAGQIMQLDTDVSLYVLSPDSMLLTSAATENQRSLVFRLECGRLSALFTGDVDSLIENRLYVWESLLDVEILKVSHHGSKTATSDAFIHATSPDIAVISSGRRAMYNHPDPSVLARLEQHGISVLTTKQRGNIEFAATSEGWTLVETPAQRLSRKWHLNAIG